MKSSASTREHRPSNLLSREENESIFSLFGPRCEVGLMQLILIFNIGLLLYQQGSFDILPNSSVGPIQNCSFNF